MTDVVHPDNRDMAIRVVMAVGLDVGGNQLVLRGLVDRWQVLGSRGLHSLEVRGARPHVTGGPGL